MSLKTSATRRLSWLAGSSLAAAFGGLALAPTAAMAQATCTSPAAPAGNGTPTVIIAAGTYNPGITCSYVGAGSVISTAGAVSVSTTAGGDGINLSATGTGAVNWVSSAGAVTGGAQTNGPVIDATSVSGAISITTVGVTANQPGTTHGIRATSTGGGAITITRATAGVNNGVAGGQAAIEAVTNGGNISITTATGFTTGRLRGVVARTSGAATVALTFNGQVSADVAEGIAGVDVTAGTGAVTMTLTNGALTGGAGKAIVVTSAGAVTINNTGGTVGSTSFSLPTIGGAVNFSAVTGSGVTFTNTGATASTGVWAASGASVFSAGVDAINMNGIGKNYLAAGASIDLGAGNDTFSVASFFGMGASSLNLATVNFGSGTDTFNVSGSLIATGAAADFGTGSDTFNLSGVLAVNGLTLNNLEALKLSGVIYLGGTSGTLTDGVADDTLRMTSGTFTGLDDAQVVLDVNLGGGVQAGCATLTGVADCLDLRGASTAGQTVLTLNNIGPSASQGGYDTVGVTLVDVGGGTSAAGDFVLDPDTENFTTDVVLGDVISRPGVFVYALRYDPSTQRHIIVGLPRSEVLNYAMLGGAAQSVWRLTADTVTDRQTDLRDGADGGSVWVRAGGEYGKRDMATAFESGGGPLAVDNSYKLYTGTVIGGMDFFVGERRGYDYALGGHLGYVSSSFDLTASPSSGRMTGAVGGVYASAWSDWFFLDGAFNANVLTLDHASPRLASNTNTYLNSLGAQVEAGTRTMLTEQSFAEPLLAVSFVRTSFEEISLAGGQVQPADNESLRAALGLRLGSTLAGESVSASYFVTGRAWYELEGESGGVVHNPGADLPFIDEFSGVFGQAEVGVNLSNSANTLSGFLTGGVKFKGGYTATNLSLGVRLAW